MKNKLMPIQGKATSNCLFFTLSTLFRFYGRNVNFHNACLWDFKSLKEGKGILSDSIFEDDLYIDQYPYIKSVSGIQFRKSEFKEINMINNCLSAGKPVLVHIDIFWCSWNANYQKLHYDHFFILNRYSIQEDSYECIDSFYLDAPVWISRSDLEKGILDIIDYDVGDNPSFAQIYPIILQALKKNISQGRDSPMFYNMLRLADAVKSIDYETEFKRHTDVNSIPLFIKLQNISLDRIALSNLCQNIYFENDLLDFRDIALEFYNLYKEWNMLLVMLMKYFITRNKRILYNSASQIMRITDLEKDMACKINRIDCN